MELLVFVSNWPENFVDYNSWFGFVNLNFIFLTFYLKKKILNENENNLIIIL